MTEYRTLSGAEFQRAVGTNPDKWADAAIEDAHRRGFTLKRDWLRAVLADAMDAAACRDSIREVIEGDKT